MLKFKNVVIQCLRCRDKRTVEVEGFSESQIKPSSLRIRANCPKCQTRTKQRFLGQKQPKNTKEKIVFT